MEAHTPTPHLKLTASFARTALFHGRIFCPVRHARPLPPPTPGTVQAQGAMTPRVVGPARTTIWGNVSEPGARRASFVTRAPPVAF